MYLNLNTEQMLSSGNAARVAAAELAAPVVGNLLDGTDIREHTNLIWDDDSEEVVVAGAIPNGQQLAVADILEDGPIKKVKRKIKNLQDDIDLIKTHLGI